MNDLIRILSSKSNSNWADFKTWSKEAENSPRPAKKYIGR
jgi:hypothetical protein